MRTYLRLRVGLSKQQRTELRQILRGEIEQAWVVLRALALLQLSAGQTAAQAAATVGLTSKAVWSMDQSYEEGGTLRGDEHRIPKDVDVDHPE